MAASPGPVGFSAHRTSSATCSATVPCRMTWDAVPGIVVTSMAQSAGDRPLRSLTNEQQPCTWMTGADFRPGVDQHVEPLFRSEASDEDRAGRELPVGTALPGEVGNGYPIG